MNDREGDEAEELGYGWDTKEQTGIQVGRESKKVRADRSSSAAGLECSE